MIVQFHVVFLRVIRNSTNCENDGILLTNDLQTFHTESNKPFRFVEFWQVMMSAKNDVNMSNEIVLFFMF